MIHLGDFPAGHTAVCIPFDSFAAATGASSATSNFAASDVLVYKDGGTAQRSSAAGITVSTSFDTQTGLQMIVIDLSDNTDAGFYAAGHEYQVAVADITIDSQTVRFWAATFSIERAGGVFARLGAPAGASVSADIAAAKVDTAAIKVKTDYLPSVVAGGAGGLFIAGANAATSITTALTANITGNVTGNLSGSVGSIASGGIAAASFGAGAINAAAIATDAIDDDAVADSLMNWIRDTVHYTALTEGYAAKGAAATHAQLLYMIQAILAERAFVSTTLTVRKLDGSTPAATFTLDDAGAPTSQTRAT